MILCKKCGHDNPLGTMFCRGCGQRLEVKAQDVFASVQQTRQDLLQDRVFKWGRQTLSIGLFLLVSGGIFACFIAPAVPDPQVPRARDQDLGILLSPAQPGWLQKRSEDGGGELALPDIKAELPATVLEWRRANAAGILGRNGLGIDCDYLRQWQRYAVEIQKKDGSIMGDEPIGCTALALLGLQALPGDPAIDQAAERCRAYLMSRCPPAKAMVAALGNLSKNLALIALLDGGLLTQEYFTIARSVLADGKAAEWQALALALLPPLERPKPTAIAAALQDSVLWRHWLDLFSDERLITSHDDSLFTLSAVANLGALDRLAWAHAAWYRAADCRVVGRVLRDWAAASELPALPPALDKALATKDNRVALQAALAVLVATAPVRAPLPWVLPLSKQTAKPPVK